MVLEESQFDVDTVSASDIEGAEDASDLLGLPLHAPKGKVKKRFKELAIPLHPDSPNTPGTSDSFRALKKATDILVEEDVEEEAQEKAEGARKGQGAGGDGAWGFGPGTRKGEMYRETVEEVKLFFLEEVNNIDIRASSVEQALADGEITTEQIEHVNDVLSEKYDVPDLTLEDMARVLSSLVVQGSVDLGEMGRMVDKGPWGTSNGNSGPYKSPGGGHGVWQSPNTNSGPYR